MNHPAEVIERIQELIELSGVTDSSFVEELTDHYLAEIETTVASGVSQLSATRSVYQRIAQTSFGTDDKKSKYKVGGLILAFLVILASLWYSNCSKQVEACHEADIEMAQLLPPDGWPIKNGENHITSGFGMRFHPIMKVSKLHQGIDIKAPMYTPVYSTGSGSILEIGYSVSAGNYVVIKHNDKYSSRYNHLGSVIIEEGQCIAEGTLIGKVGNSGMSIAPHLHYEIREEGELIDPLTAFSS